VFLFLDNIWDSSTLKKLLPAGTALPPGSAVLATTRQADAAEVLSDLKSVDNESEDCNYQEHQADLLSKKQAQQLFHRLLHQSPTKAGSLTQEQEDGVVGLCGNHPLLLTVMAPILRKHPSKWERVKRNLAGSGSVKGFRDKGDWLSQLKVSCDVLEDYLQQAFLDIAHVWRGRSWEEAEACFGHVGHEPEKLQLLVEHSLVSKGSPHSCVACISPIMAFAHLC